MRFRKTIKLLPGVKINIGKTGLSTSIGPKGATVNLKPGRKARASVGIPGTGISHSQNLSGEPLRDHSSGNGVFWLALIIGFGVLVWLFK